MKYKGARVPYGDFLPARSFSVAHFRWTAPAGWEPSSARDCNCVLDTTSFLPTLYHYALNVRVYRFLMYRKNKNPFQKGKKAERVHQRKNDKRGSKVENCVSWRGLTKVGTRHDGLQMFHWWQPDLPASPLPRNVNLPERLGPPSGFGETSQSNGEA
jgi:hypothetical protein